MSTAFATHPDCSKHDTGPGHPERPARLEALARAAEDDPELSGALQLVEGRHATTDELERVHPASHIERIREAVDRAAGSGRLVHLDPDTAVGAGSWDAALAAAGTLVDLTSRIFRGELRNGFCAVRPPGHHALADRAMGFCLFNNVAVAARHAQAEHGARRVMIIDWDVHHGNGTEAIFYDDPDVFYVSMHQSPHYPGTGGREDRGSGSGVGTTLNLPVPPGLPPERYVRELLEGLEQALSDFQPDIIFISSGFDAAAGDPLAGLTLGPAHYHLLTRWVAEAAAEHCDGRVASLLEGGYQLDNLARCGAAHLRALAELPPS